MATGGPSFPGTGADDSSHTGVTWNNPTYIQADDTSRATAYLSGAGTDYSHYLSGTVFGFAVPSGSTIDGITFAVQARASRNSNYDFIRDHHVCLLKNGAVYGNDKADLVTKWPTVEATVTYGAVNDLWGGSWTAEDINASNFGVVMAVLINYGDLGCIAVVDCYQITITYTAPGGVKFCAVVCSKVNGVTVSKFDGVT
jgi:hypothetical protein